MDALEFIKAIKQMLSAGANNSTVQKYISAYEAVWKSARALKKIPAADVAPIEALEHLRDELCAQDLITMEGLRKLNTLIWKYTTVHDGGADHEAD